MEKVPLRLGPDVEAAENTRVARWTSGGMGNRNREVNGVEQGPKIGGSWELAGKLRMHQDLDDVCLEQEAIMIENGTLVG